MERRTEVQHQGNAKVLEQSNENTQKKVITGQKPRHAICRTWRGFIVYSYIKEQKYLNYIEQFESIKENFENLNLLKHDAKKYISINKLILGINYEEVLKYINKLNNTDIFRKHLIITKTDINIIYDLNISSVDMVCLLGNLLDNCIEANII